MIVLILIFAHLGRKLRTEHIVYVGVLGSTPRISNHEYQDSMTISSKK